MFLKNVLYGLLLGFFCVTIYPLQAKKNKAPLGPTQYRVSSDQFFNKLNLQTDWYEFKAGQIDLDGFKRLISRSFETIYESFTPKPWWVLRREKEESVFETLVKWFGPCATEHKWIKNKTEEWIKELSRQAKTESQAARRPFCSWQRCAEWSNCGNAEVVKVILEKIKEKIFSFLDTMQKYQDMPEFWIIVTNIKAGNELKLLIECVVDPAQLPIIKRYNQVTGDSNQSAVARVQDGDDDWENVQLSANCPVKTIMLAAGLVIVTYGIIEGCLL